MCNLHDPDGQGQVDDHGRQQHQQEEIDAPLPPAVKPRRVGRVAAPPLEVQGAGGQDKLFLGHLQDKHRVW